MRPHFWTRYFVLINLIRSISLGSLSVLSVLIMTEAKANAPFLLPAASQPSNSVSANTISPQLGLELFSQTRRNFNFSNFSTTSTTGKQLLALKKTRGKSYSAGQSNTRAQATALLKMGTANYKKGYINKAIPQFEKAVKLTPNSKMALQWLGKSYMRVGTPEAFEKAKATYGKLLALDPTVFDALVGRGELLTWNTATRTEGIGLLKKAFKQQPNNAAVSQKLASALLWQGDATQALYYAEPAASQNITTPNWLPVYAEILMKNNQAAKALAVLEEPAAQALVKTSQPVRFAYLKALSANNKTADLAQKTQDLLFQSAQIKDTKTRDQQLTALMQLAYETRQFETALSIAGQLSADGLANSETALIKARALAKLFRNPEALEQYQQLYTNNRLGTSEKLEYAEFLHQLQLPESALPSPGLMRQLGEDIAQDPALTHGQRLQLTRLQAQQALRSNQDDAFERALANYKILERTKASSDQGNASGLAALRRERLDFIKSYKGNPARVEQALQQILQDDPDNLYAQAAYAEFLSWQPERRDEALSRYIAIAKRDKVNAAQWEARITEVLRWTTPEINRMGTYKAIVSLYPENKMAWLSIARAHRDNADTPEAIKTYEKLVALFPGDGAIKKEWVALLLGDEDNRSKHMKALKKRVETAEANNTRVDPDIQATYGKLLSYTRDYKNAMRQFDTVLASYPMHRESLLGKGYTLLWRGSKFKAKDFFSDLHNQYPDDLDIAIGLAQAKKRIGRYDEALKILNQLKPSIDAPAQANPAASPYQQNQYQPEAVPPVSYPRINPVIDSSAVPSKPSLANRRFPAVVFMARKALTPRKNSVPKKNQATAQTTDTHLNQRSPLINQQASGQTVTESALSELKDDANALSDAILALKYLQKSSEKQLDTLAEQIAETKNALPEEQHFAHFTMSTPQNESAESFNAGARPNATGYSNSYSKSYSKSKSGSPFMIGQAAMQESRAVYSSLGYDTNPLLSGLGRFKNDDLSDLENSIFNDLRPMMRAGVLFSTQDAEDTTTGLSYLGFPNQMAVSLTPQIRLRGGIEPTLYYLPDGVDPDSSWGTRYGLGATVKYWDRLTLDGDIALTAFSQTDDSNITFNAEARYDFTDNIRGKIGASRLPQLTSLLTVTGLRPSRGAFRGDVVGQARENSLFVELNTNPFNHNWDWNLGYAWAFIDGSEIPTNYKNQAFTSLGYTWRYAEKQQVRLGYELLYFGYSKNATNGFFDTTSTGLRGPVSTLRPPTLANVNYDFGGYYSPSLFFLNSARIDFRGSLFEKFLEYKLGGSLGAQTVRLGQGIRESGNNTTLSSAFDANMIMNFTDSFALYGNVDFLDAGGQFNRWRFGSGLIVRPDIKALSPVFGGGDS
ncbi:MAG: tetratricopeptide repeat protein [Cyanobacteria bacterium P01_H01_bin.74]